MINFEELVTDIMCDISDIYDVTLIQGIIPHNDLGMVSLVEVFKTLAKHNKPADDKHKLKILNKLMKTFNMYNAYRNAKSNQTGVNE